MKNVNFKKIGNKEVVVSIDDPPVDPLESNRKMYEVLETNEGFQIRKNLMEAYNKALLEKRDINSTYYQAFANKNESVLQDLKTKYRLKEEQLKEIDRQVAELNVKYSEEWETIRRETLVYSTPKNGKLITVDQAEKLQNRLDNLERGHLLTTNEEILNKRDIEKDRVRSLSPEEREKEKLLKLKKAMVRSKEIKLESEIEGDSDSVSKAKTHFEKEKKQINELYDVEG